MRFKHIDFVGQLLAVVGRNQDIPLIRAHLVVLNVFIKAFAAFSPVAQEGGSNREVHNSTRIGKEISCLQARHFFSGKRYEMKSYKQLTYEQRCQIEVPKKSGVSQQEIARLIDVNQSSASRELSRHNQAHRKSVEYALFNKFNSW